MLKKIIVLNLLLISFPIMAQHIPSIPKTYPKKVVKQARSNVVWGTQYDFLSTRYIGYEDIMNYDKGQLRVLRNSIYARHGRIFKDKNLRTYFNSLSWYKGIHKEIPARELNKYEKANIEFLKKHE